MFTKNFAIHLSFLKIAAYDIDGTIIKTKSGNVFPKSYDDWQIAFNEVPKVLKEKYAEKYKIVFFTNQAGMSAQKTVVAEWKVSFSYFHIHK